MLPRLARDTSDRNRTSPFAFTGSKFEFRMPGSSFNIACTNVMLNTAVAESLRLFADELEAAGGAPAEALPALLRRELRSHRRILFGGDGYGPAWEAEAARRGLSNCRTTPEALAHFTDEKNLALFARHGVYTAEEVRSRQEIGLEEYAKTVRIEALTLLDMARASIAPVCMRYAAELAQGANAQRALGVDAPEQQALAARIAGLTGEVLRAADALEREASALPADAAGAAGACAARVLPAMDAVRRPADALEGLVDRALWPFPTYADLLFYA